MLGFSHCIAQSIRYESYDLSVFVGNLFLRSTSGGTDYFELCNDKRGANLMRLEFSSLTSVAKWLLVEENYWRAEASVT